MIKLGLFQGYKDEGKKELRMFGLHYFGSLQAYGFYIVKRKVKERIKLVVSLCLI